MNAEAKCSLEADFRTDQLQFVDFGYFCRSNHVKLNWTHFIIRFRCIETTRILITEPLVATLAFSYRYSRSFDEQHIE